MDLPKTHSNYCRICFTENKNFKLKPISEENRENFRLITNLHLIKSETFSNLICTDCSSQLSTTKKYRDELISNEKKLMEQLESSKLSDLPECSVILIKMEEESMEIIDDQQSSSDEWEPPPSPPPEVKKRPQKSKNQKSHQKFNKLTQLKFKEEIEKLPQTEDGRVICALCTTPILKTYYRQHLERKHKFMKNYSCDLCGKQFFNFKPLENHMNVHLFQKPFPCTHEGCDKNLTSKKTLREHIKRCHKQSEFTCEICAKSYKMRWLLMDHINIKHKGKKYKCTYPDCTLEYFSSSALKKHVNSVHLSIEVPCEICGLLLKTGFQMYQHKRFRHSDLKFACSHCGKRYATRSMMLTHEKIHKGQKDHVCKICNARYHVQRNLKRHIQVSHRKTKFFCKVVGCNSVLCNKDIYRMHVKKVHHMMPNSEMQELLKAIKDMKPDFIEEEGEGGE